MLKAARRRDSLTKRSRALKAVHDMLQAGETVARGVGQNAEHGADVPPRVAVLSLAPSVARMNRSGGAASSLCTSPAVGVHPAASGSQLRPTLAAAAGAARAGQ
ncbi:hypothetical protein GCM10009646_79610 [Streptomyces aureus]